MTKLLLIPALLLALAINVSGQMPPKGFIIPDNTLSPDGRYGITVPIRNEHPYDPKAPDPKNSLVNIKEGRVLAAINTRYAGYDFQNHGGILPTRWTPDGSLVLWEVAGKWMRDALVVLRVEGGRVVWQADVLKTAQQELLVRTRRAEPKRFAVAKKANARHGSAYPEGFTIDARVVGELAFPLHVHAALTADPKGALERDKQLSAYLEGTLDDKGRFAVTAFGADTEMPAYDDFGPGTKKSDYEKLEDIGPYKQ